MNSDLALLKSFLKNVFYLDESQLEVLDDYCSLISVPKGTILLKEGQVCRNLYLIQSGLMCRKMNKDGEEVITMFSYEFQFVTSLYSFISQKPSYDRIEALEDCMVYEISYDNLQELYKNIPIFDKLGRLLTEQYYVLLEERMMTLQHQSAIEKYTQFIEQEPELYQRITLKQLSSFLGISQETLSRIRAKKN